MAPVIIPTETIMPEIIAIMRALLVNQFSNRIPIDFMKIAKLRNIMKVIETVIPIIFNLLSAILSFNS